MDFFETLIAGVILAITIISVSSLTSWHGTQRSFIENGYVQQQRIGAHGYIWVKNK